LYPAAIAGVVLVPMVTWLYGRPLRRQTEPSESAVSFSAAVGPVFQHQIVSGYAVVRSMVVPVFAEGYPANPFVKMLVHGAEQVVSVPSQGKSVPSDFFPGRYVIVGS